MATTYRYRARDPAGRLRTGTLVANGQGLVIRRLREMGYVPLEVARAGTGLQREVTLRPGHVRPRHLAVFFRQFATMVNAGLPILRALAILADQTESRELSKVLTRSRLDVEQGHSLSEAMARHPRTFTDLHVAMVRSGETGGVLDAVLLRIADQVERQVELRRKVKSAMTYPAVVVVFVSLILTAMLVFVVPQFEDIYAELGSQLPIPTRILLGVSRLVRTYWYGVLAGGLLGWFLFRRYRATDRGREQVDRLKLRIPIFGPLFHKAALARFASTLGMLLRSGVPILQSLDIVAETVNNRPIARAVAEVKGSVREGESVARPLAQHRVFPPMVVQMLAVGEETGAVDAMLEKVASFYEAEVEAAVEALTSLIEPVLIAIIGGAVGAAVIALYMPMFNLVNLIR